MKKVLIQLIGGQTLPNIFSLLAVVPDVVVNIYTKDTEAQHEAIVAWCNKNGSKFNLNPVFREYPPVSRDFQQLRSNLQSILNDVAEHIRNEEDALLILNMTGGTKPMSVTSTDLCGALEHDNNICIPVFYVDTQMKRFDFFTHEEMRDKVLVHAPFESGLSVSQLAESGGNTSLLDYRTDWKRILPAARLLRECSSHLREVNITAENVGEIIQLPLDQLVSEVKQGEAKYFVERALHDPAVIGGLQACGFSARDGSIYFCRRLRKYANRIVQLKQQGGKLSGNDWGEVKRCLYAIQAAQSFLVGGWWEVLVANAYGLKNPESEVLWSVRTPVGGGEALETDIVATDGLSLTCISCKRGLHKLINQELEQHCTRTEVLGGAISKRIIAVYYPKDAEKMAPMAKALHMELWTRETVDKIEAEFSAN